MTDVIIHVKSVQIDSNGEENSIELLSVGRSYKKNNIIIITYKETELSGMEGATTVLKIYQDHVSLLRMGSIEQKQEYFVGQKSYCNYRTPFGKINMSVYTKLLEVDFVQNTGTIKIHYDIEIEGQHQSSNMLLITVREDKCYGRQKVTS